MSLTESEIREKYIAILSKEATAMDTLKEWDGQWTDSATQLAYKASFTAMQAREISNFLMAPKYLGDAQKLFDYAVELDASNIEVRMLRFAVENVTPSMLGMSKNVGEDIEFAAQNIEELKKVSMPSRAIKKVLSMMAENSNATEEQKQLFLNTEKELV